MVSLTKHLSREISVAQEPVDKTNRIAPQRLKGFRDLLPQTMFVRQRVIDTLRHIFELHGFYILETPSWGIVDGGEYGKVV